MSYLPNLQLSGLSAIFQPEVVGMVFMAFI